MEIISKSIVKKLILVVSIALIVCFGLAACNSDNSLAAPVITLDNNVISWSPVDNADAYKIYQDDKLVSSQTETSYAIGALSPGTYKFTVKATSSVSDFAASPLSNVVTYVAEATAPTKLNAPAVSLVDSSLVWEAVSNATYYEVFEDDKLVSRQAETTYLIDKSDSPGEYAFCVRAGSSDSRFAVSDFSDKVVFVAEDPSVKVRLDAPEISFDQTTRIISWQPVEHANSYMVYENRDLLTSITETSFAVTQSVVGDYVYKVIATSSNIKYTASDFSNEVTVTVLPTKLVTPVVTREGTTLIWDAVDNADGYDIFENDVLVKTNANPGYEIAWDENKIGTFVYTVVALAGKNPQYLDSDPSEPVTIFLSDDRVTLATPDVELSGNVLSWTPVPDADGYEVYEVVQRNGDDVYHRVFITEELYYNVTKLKPSTYRFCVRAITDKFMEFKPSERSEIVSYVIPVVDEDFDITVDASNATDLPNMSLTVEFCRKTSDPKYADGLMPIPNKSASVQISAGASAVATVNISNGGEYVVRCSNLPNGYIATFARVSADNPNATVTVYKKENLLQVGDNRFNSDGSGVGNGYSLFVASESGNYSITTHADGLYMELNGINIIDSPSYSEYVFYMYANETVVLTMAGFNSGWLTYNIAKGDIKQQLYVAEKGGEGKGNYIAYGQNSSTRYLTLEEETTLTFEFYTATIGMSFVTITIDGVSYDFDGDRNTSHNITIGPCTDKPILIEVWDFSGSASLSKPIGFYVYPVKST